MLKKIVLCIVVFIKCPAGYSQIPELIKDIDPAGSGIDIYNPALVEYNNRGYFGGKDDANGTELWATDGTAAGIVMVKDIWTGAGSGFPSRITIFNGALFFSAYDVAHGEELWVSDGIDARTHLVKDINRFSWQRATTQKQLTCGYFQKEFIFWK